MDGISDRWTHCVLIALTAASLIAGCSRSVLRRIEPDAVAAEVDSTTAAPRSVLGALQELNGRRWARTPPPARSENDRTEVAAAQSGEDPSAAFQIAGTANEARDEGQLGPLPRALAKCPHAVALVSDSDDPTDRDNTSALSRTPGNAGAVLERGRETLRYAEDLAQRGALHAARVQALSVLRMVAQLHDAQHRSNDHIEAMNSALTALEEVKDFDRAGPGGESVEAIVAGHAAGVVDPLAAANLCAIDAVQLYCNSAIRQLVLAAGGQPLSSDALYLIGRISGAQAAPTAAAAGTGFAELQALVCYQAAFLINPQNHAVANELGVLLARRGQFLLARIPLEHSVAAHPLPQNCLNLALVLEQLGETTGANELRARSRQLQESQTDLVASAPGAPGLRWVTASELVQARSSLDAVAGNTPAAGDQPHPQIKSTDAGRAQSTAPRKWWYLLRAGGVSDGSR